MELKNNNKNQFKTAIRRDGNLDSCETAIMILLVDMYNEKQGYAYPSYNIMAQYTKFSRSKVIESTKKLKEKGYLEWKKGNLHVNNQYKILDKWFDGVKNCGQDINDEVYCGQNLDDEVYCGQDID